MKISNGTILEFLFAIFFLSVGINMGISFMGIIVIVISILVVIHCLYLWVNRILKKEKTSNTNNDIKITVSKPKKLYLIIMIISVLLNIILCATTLLYINKNNGLKTKSSKIINENKKLKKENKNLNKSEEENRDFLMNRINELYNKTTFFDKYIVIIPENTGYYYTYDCWNKKGRSNNFRIMNWKDAQSYGYIKGNC